MAAGERLEREQRQVELLDDLRAIVTGPAAHLVDLVARLGELRPGVYGHLDPTSLGSMLRAAGVSVSTVWDPSKPREQAAGKGIRREWLDQPPEPGLRLVSG